MIAVARFVFQMESQVALAVATRWRSASSITRRLLRSATLFRDALAQTYRFIE